MSLECSEKTPYCFAFITYGVLKSAAYNRARFMSSKLAEIGNQVWLVIDEMDENSSEKIPWISSTVNVARVPRGNHIRNIYARRKILAQIEPDFVINLGATLKSYLTLFGAKHSVINEWDEPRHLARNSFLTSIYVKCMRTLTIHRSKYNVACAEELLKEKVYNAYIPHGNYLEKTKWNKPTQSLGPATYMGNLYPGWDHGLIMTGLKIAADRGYRPKVRIIGAGVEFDYWKNYANENKLYNIIFTGAVYGSDMIELLASSRVLLYPAVDNMVNRTRCSSKLFAYAETGRPVIAHDVGEANNILGSRMIPVKPGHDLISVLEKFETHDSICSEGVVPDNSYNDRASRLLNLIKKG